MALIGPRLERPAFCAEFEKRIHGWNYRALVKPGLSGLAQVRGGYDLLPKEKVALDLWRVGYPSLRIARVTDPPHSSIISTALRLCSSVQLGIRELLTGPIRSNYLSEPLYLASWMLSTNTSIGHNEGRIKISLGGISPMQYKRSLGLAA